MSVRVMAAFGLFGLRVGLRWLDLYSRELAEVFGGEKTGRGGFVGHVGCWVFESYENADCAAFAVEGSDVIADVAGFIYSPTEGRRLAIELTRRETTALRASCRLESL